MKVVAKGKGQGAKGKKEKGERNVPLGRLGDQVGKMIKNE